MSAIKPIYFTSLITTALALLIIGGIIWKSATRQQRPFLFLLFALELPMCALAFVLLRDPLLSKLWVYLALHFDSSSTPATVKESTIYYFLHAFEAPISEDLSKLWPMLLLFIPAVRKYYDKAFVPRTKVVLAAMSLGLGFGVGEIWVVAGIVAKQPIYDHLHFWNFGGFFKERLIVCVVHGAFTAVAVTQIGKGAPRVVLGILFAMSIHFINNFPLFLLQIDFLHWGKQHWAPFAVRYIVVYFVLMIALLARLYSGGWQLGRFFFGRAHCPECKQLYDRPLLGIRAFPRRYERCASCRRYHWIDELHDVVKDEPEREKTAESANA